MKTASESKRPSTLPKVSKPLINSILVVRNLGLGESPVTYLSLDGVDFKAEIWPGIFFQTLIKNSLGEVIGARLLTYQGEISLAKFSAKKAPTNEVALYLGGDFIASYAIMDKKGEAIEERSYSLSLLLSPSKVIYEDDAQGHLLVKGVVHGQKEISIPEIYQGREVYGIFPYAFMDENELETVTLPPSLKHIPSYAFMRCPNLVDVDIPPSIARIDDYAFHLCPKVVPPLLKKRFISKKAFYGCKGKARNIFAHCSDEVSKEKTQHLASFAPEKLVVPNSIKKIGPMSFLGFQMVNEVILQEGLLEIGSSAFYDCRKLSNIAFPLSLEKLGGLCLAGTAITSIAVAGSLTELPLGCFEGCKKLKSVKLGGNVKNIGKNAFFGCSSLEEINLPTYLEKIDDNAFKGCSKLKKIHYGGKISDFKSLLKRSSSRAFSSVIRAEILCADGPTRIR